MDLFPPLHRPVDPLSECLDDMLERLGVGRLEIDAEQHVGVKEMKFRKRGGDDTT
jgi:hypothetical protein